jgi:hypothetical protein
LDPLFAGLAEATLETTLLIAGLAMPAPLAATAMAACTVLDHLYCSLLNLQTFAFLLPPFKLI